MSIESASRKSLAAFLVISAALLGAALLDEVSYLQQDEEFRTEIERRFVDKSLKIGAWAMDRGCVARYIGLNEKDLPSYQMTEEKALTADLRPCPTPK